MESLTVEQHAQREEREPAAGKYTIAWVRPGGFACSVEVTSVDNSCHGMRAFSPEEVAVDSEVYVHGDDMPGQHAHVRHCTPFGDGFHIGLEFGEEGNPGFQRHSIADDNDYYEVLQINPKADADTIHRVFRLMAMRFHPDNPETGNIETFLKLKRAYEVLSDPEQRALYDAQRDAGNGGPMPVFELRDFVEGVQGEVNRRLGVLCLLYNRRRTDPDHPGISLLDLEQRMGFPREYLNFTMWYLRAKSFVTLADNSDYALTAEGADYVEANACENEPLAKLIGSGFWTPPKPRDSERDQTPVRRLLNSAPSHLV
jgi:hypothetical protein